MTAWGRTLLLAASLAASNSLRLGAQRPLGRRAAFASLGGVLVTPQIAQALDPNKDRPNDSLLLILRDTEAAHRLNRLVDLHLWP